MAIISSPQFVPMIHPQGHICGIFAPGRLHLEIFTDRIETEKYPPLLALRQFQRNLPTLVLLLHSASYLNKILVSKGFNQIDAL